MSALSDFHDLLLPELPGCTVAMVNKNLREAAREFCDRTGLWRQSLTAIDTVAAQATYALATPTDSQLVRISEITVNSLLLWRLSRRERADWSELCPKYDLDEPPFVLSAGLTTITLDRDEIPTASVVGGLVVEATLTPTPTAATLPDFLLSKYSEAIRYGTLSRLMKMKKPWGDRPLAMDYQTRWNQALNFGGYQAEVGNTRRPLRTKKAGI